MGMVHKWLFTILRKLLGVAPAYGLIERQVNWQYWLHSSQELPVI